MVYTSFDWNPCFGRQVVLLTILVNRFARLFHTTSIVVKLNLNVLRNNFRLGIEQSQRVSLSHLKFVGQKGLGATSRVGNNASIL